MSIGKTAFFLRDPCRAAGALAHDPIGAAYLLGDLDEPYIRHTAWYGFGTDEDHDSLVTVLMVYRGLTTPALITFGEKAGLQPILETFESELPRRCLAMVWPDHEPDFEKVYIPTFSRRMIRMGVAKDAFRPYAGRFEAKLLVMDDLPELLDLMKHYPGNYFEPSMFREGYQFGIKLEGRLVSAGGVHTCSPAYGVAAIGNIVTHASQRRRGLASACTSALVARLFESVEHIALNVEAVNRAAIRCYEGLGFTTRLSYKEGVYCTRDGL